MANRKRGRSPGRPKLTEGEKPTNELILQTAADLFLRNGFGQVSIDDIAKAAGMTKATVYYYFESKAVLFKEVMVALMNRIRGRIILLLGADKPLYDRLYEMTVAHFRATTSFDLEGFMRESRTSLSLDQVNEIRMAEESMYVSIEQAFLDAIEAGEIPQIHAKFAAHSFIALIKVGNYKQPDGASFFPRVEETAEHILKAFWRGFIGDLN